LNCIDDISPKVIRHNSNVSGLMADRSGKTASTTSDGNQSYRIEANTQRACAEGPHDACVLPPRLATCSPPGSKSQLRLRFEDQAGDDERVINDRIREQSVIGWDCHIAEDDRSGLTAAENTTGI
jgi:hypothetical protein